MDSNLARRAARRHLERRPFRFTEDRDWAAQFLSPKEAGRLLNVHTDTLRRWRVAGHGPAYCRLGHRIRYHVEDLQDYVEAARSW